VLKDDAAQRELFAIFDAPELHQRYTVRTGIVPFRGGTTSGELRELCGVFTDYLVLNPHTISNCLPQQLKRHGYRTTALHGYKREYYSRHRWYPRLFERLVFEDSLAAAARCGTQFRGICDRDVFHRFKQEVQRRDTHPRFTYWLTIDAHTPVDLDRRRELPAEMRSTAGCGTEDVCLVVYFWRETLQRIAQLAADPATPRTRFIVVGDHAPAFVRQSRASRLVPGYVPFVELVPK
jgi:phosphoglycerol transferase MdoB-like AlkP superfamily enzyme